MECRRPDHRYNRQRDRHGHAVTTLQVDFEMVDGVPGPRRLKPACGWDTPSPSNTVAKDPPSISDERYPNIRSTFRFQSVIRCPASTLNTASSDASSTARKRARLGFRLSGRA